MKQLIVLIATIVLGIGIAGVIMTGFGGTAESLQEKSINGINSVFTDSAFTYNPANH